MKQFRIETSAQSSVQCITFRGFGEPDRRGQFAEWSPGVLEQ
jgi:hypothetical protein